MERIGGSVASLKFLFALRHHLGERVVLSEALFDGDGIGQTLSQVDEEQSQLHELLSGIDSAGFDRHAMELLTSHQICWAMDEGLKTFNFGRTPAEFDDDVFRFKSRFGGKSQPTLQWEKGLSPLLWPIYRVVRRRYEE